LAARNRISVVTVLLAAGGALAQGPCHDLSPIDATVRSAVTILNLPGAAMLVEQGGSQQLQRTWGSYQPTTRIPIYSGSKWLAASVLLTLSDEGRLMLDDRVSRWLPNFTGQKSAITIRQCLAHTSGLPPTDPSIGNAALTLAQSVDQIALVALPFTPGTAFQYGEVGMQVAGRVAEIVTGKSWTQLANERLFGPLGMTATDWALPTNPHLGGGVVSTLRDYAVFLRMIRNGGMHGAQRILSPGALWQMFRDQTNGVPMYGWNPSGARYGLGCWRDRTDSQGRLLQVGSQGALGFTPWYDLERDVVGLFIVEDQLVRVYGLVTELQRMTRNALKPTGIVCVGGPTWCGATPLTCNGSGIPHAGRGDFLIRSDGAPGNAPGAVMAATKPDPVGTLILGARLHLALDGSLIALPLVADAVGSTVGLASLAQAYPGARFTVQYAWLYTTGCSQPYTLGASHAIEITVQ
jgi:CubicO group peptidase (beta-lactamase class C family)